MLPDLERLTVAWAKGDSAIDALVAGGVATRIPKKQAWSSFLRVVTIDGTFEVAETGDIGTAVLQFDSFAKSSGPSPDYAAASLLARTVVASIYAATSGVFVADEGEIVGFGFPTMPRRVEEPETGWARYMFECSLTGRALT